MSELNKLYLSSEIEFELSTMQLYSCIILVDITIIRYTFTDFFVDDIAYGFSLSGATEYIIHSL